MEQGQGAIDAMWAAAPKEDHKTGARAIKKYMEEILPARKILVDNAKVAASEAVEAYNIFKTNHVKILTSQFYKGEQSLLTTVKGLAPAMRNIFGINDELSWVIRGASSAGELGGATAGYLMKFMKYGNPVVMAVTEVGGMLVFPTDTNAYQNGVHLGDCPNGSCMPKRSAAKPGPTDPRTTNGSDPVTNCRQIC